MLRDIRLRDLELLDRIARLRSISAAADEMGVTSSTAGRWLAHLEACLGVRLVERTTRTLALTQRGRELRLRAADVVAAMNAAVHAMHTQLPRGTVRVSVPIPLGRLLVGALVSRVGEHMPEVRLEIKVHVRNVDLVRDRLDLAVVAGELRDSDVIARKLTTAEVHLYLSPRWASQQLDQVPLIGSPGDEVLLRASREHAGLGAPRAVVDDRTSVADALISGAGIGLLPSFLGEPAVVRGDLQRVSIDPVATLPVWALYREPRQADPRIELLLGELQGALRGVA